MNEEILLRTFDKYFEGGKLDESRGRYNRARLNYKKAAELMLELAKTSSPKLRSARVERAKRLIEMAEALPEELERQARPPVYDNAPGGSQKIDDDDGAAFTAAEIPDISFNDVAGLEAVKNAIRIKMIYPMQHPELYSALGKKSGGGVLLYGPPGTGKTMIAKAIAHEVGAKFYAVKCSDIVSKWVGESEKNIAELFDTARRDDRAIVFFDELDSLFYKRGKDTHNDRRVNELLQQIDGFNGQSGSVLILGATNNPWSVDDAAMRPGRFSQKIYVGLPDAPARAFLISHSLKKVKCDEVIDIQSIVDCTEGYSGADIKELIDRATDFPLERSLSSGTVSGLRASDIEKALRVVRRSVEQSTVDKFIAWEAN